VRVLIWAVACLIALMWTGAIAVAAGAASWAAQLLESGSAIEWAREAAQLPVPGWIAIWVDPAIVRYVQEAVVWSIDVMQSALPFAEAVLDWLVPLAWATWGAGMLVVLALAGGLHWLASDRLTGPRPA
jgi:hypothetical protein